MVVLWSINKYLPTRQTHQILVQCSHGGWNQEFKIDREHLVTNYLAGFEKAGGCCNKESKKLSEADLKVCRQTLYVDVKRTSDVSVNEPYIDKSFLKSQPAVKNQAGVYTCDPACKV